jgi:serine O-acetyltransferase
MTAQSDDRDLRAKLDRVTYMWKSDLYRYAGKTSIRTFLFTYAAAPGFRYSVYQRLFHEFFPQLPYRHPPTGLRAVTQRMAAAWLRRYAYKFGIEIPLTTEIGPGLFIGHFGGLVVNAYTTIGSNCNLSQDVTIGKAGGGDRMGWPTVGDSVYIAPGAKLIGDIHVGDHAAIGANCVVTEDVPPLAVVVGVPGRVISYDGSHDYVNNTWPPAK